MLPSRAIFEYNVKDCVATSVAYEQLLEELRESPAEWALYHDLVVPLTDAVMRMRERGMPVDAERRATMIDEARARLAHLHRELRQAIGDWFEPTNRNHIAKWLFEVRKHEPIGYTKALGRPRVDKETLTTILLEHGDDDPIYRTLIEFLDLDKYCSTFLEGVVPARNGRIYTYWLVHGTATGRLASRKPDLQNLPKEEPRNARRMFVAPPGYCFVAADATQLELRILAYATQCPFLMEALERGDDLHALTAARNYGIPVDQVTPHQRKIAKNYRYAEVYWAGDERIRQYLLVKQQLRLTLAEIRRLRENQTAQEPEVAAWRERQLAELRATRKSVNAYGRVRRVFVPEADLRGVAANSKIQSTAADYINRVFVALDRLGAPIVCQVHDEILLEVPIEERDYWCEVIKREFERPQPIFGRQVVLPCDVSEGECWGQMRKVR